MAEDETTELGRNQRGEIWVKAPNIMRGYWRKPEATKETLTPDGWLKTGDIGYVDDSGMFFIVDRKKVRFASCCAIFARSWGSLTFSLHLGTHQGQGQPGGTSGT